MSRDYINPDEVPGDVAASLRDIRAATERIADTLDDYMEMSLSAIEVTQVARGLDADVAETLRPLVDALTAIRARRAGR